MSIIERIGDIVSDDRWIPIQLEVCDKLEYVAFIRDRSAIDADEWVAYV